MSFWGQSFIFDGIPSETHSLGIHTPDGSDASNMGSSNVELLTQEVWRKAKEYLLGVKHAENLEFDVSFRSENELTTADLNIIQKWLFGHQSYKQLQIVQYDMDTIYFNCFLMSPTVFRAGNLIKGVNATVRCDSPFGWTFPKVLSNDYVDVDVSETIVFNNLSDDNDYLYPEIIITMNSSGGDLVLTNSSDDDRVFSFAGLSADEIVTVKNELNIISSSTGLRRLDTFNKKWFRFTPGRNSILVEGNISNLTINYQFAKKMGG